jgi:glycosyltransferase involved in cell wall biosynthesis
MAVYNVAPYLREAMDSILTQTYTDFEFLIYNDGSTDNTAAVVRSYNDPRIVFIDHATNRSVSPNLNEGLERARGRYIVRMDGDDVAYPERIARQVAYLDAHPEVGLCGSAVRYIGATQAIIRLPEEDEVIQHTLWLQNAFYQPAVAIRASVLRQHHLCYDVAYEFAEDYKLWSDMSAVTKLHNLPDVLLDYRIHPHQISRRQSAGQHRVSTRIRKEQMVRLGLALAPGEEEVFDLFTNASRWRHLRLPDYRRIVALVRGLYAQARQQGLALGAVHYVLTAQWHLVVQAAGRYQATLAPLFLRDPLGGLLLNKRALPIGLKCLVGWRPLLPQTLQRYWQQQLSRRGSSS